jgi:hypothetical protein
MSTTMIFVPGCKTNPVLFDGTPNSKKKSISEFIWEDSFFDEENFVEIDVIIICEIIQENLVLISNFIECPISQ